MGDPLGIGPEVILKSLASRGVRDKVIPIIAGLPSVMRKTERLVGCGNVIEALSRNRVAEASKTGVVYVLTPEELAQSRNSRRFASLTRTFLRSRGPSSRDLALRGEVAFACVKEAVNLCIHGDARALVTAPLSKASLAMAGINYPGHTEMLRDICGSKQTLMMFVRGTYRISLVTTHVPLAGVRKAVTRRSIARAITLTHRSLELLFNVSEPRLAVLSLNPHKGENGLLGSEEKNVIEPAIEAASRGGVKVSGPYAADSFFSRGDWRNFDAVVAMYHDQGLIAAKLIGGERVTNITLGLPFVRTSPGHGVAEDLAGKGIAEPQGMMSAILLAAKLGGTVRLPLEWN